MSRSETVLSPSETLAAERPSDVARRVLETEIQGLRDLCDELDGAFDKAVDLLAGIDGRVIVTGMGKSGHIARKIAATRSEERRVGKEC